MVLETSITTYLANRKADARYASFDYCYNYFQSFREAGNVGAPAEPGNIQLGCLHLGFFLASWGMYRGSSELLRMSARYLVPIVELVARAKTPLWDLDAHCYSDHSIAQLLETGGALRKIQPAMSDTLITKIMLGVFGSVPAFDTNFKRGFGVSSFGRKALRMIGMCYEENQMLIERLRTSTLDFVSGEPTTRKYTRAKVIDMAFFIQGM